MKKNTGSVFYGLAVVFLIITVLIAFNSYQTLAQSASDYGVSLGDQWVSVLVTIITASFGFLGFSFVFYGIGMILTKLDTNEIKNNNHLKKKK